MKAYLLHTFSGPDGLKCEDLPSPKPGPGQVLVRLRAASLNYRDLMVSKGLYNPRLKLPIIPLSDGAGEIIATGDSATRFKVGDRVVACFAPSWQDGAPTEANGRSALGAEASGVLAEQIVISEEGLLPIPAYLSFAEAATLPCAAVTAWNALVEQGGIKPGDTVLIQGTGGVSLFALQFAKLAGATVIATSSSDAKLEKVRAMGASASINYKTYPDWDKQVREITGGRGVDRIVEVGGAGTLSKSVRAARVGGYIALIGVLSGAGDFNPISILMKSIRLQGLFVGSRRIFEDMIRAMESSKLQPVVDRVFPFDQAIDALKYLESGAHFGKVVIGFPD